MSPTDQPVRFPEMSSAQRSVALRLANELNPDAKLEIYEPAFAGILHRCGGLKPVAVYDVERILDMMIEQDATQDPMELFDATTLAALSSGGENTEAFAHFSYENYDVDKADYTEFAEFEDALVALVEYCGFGPSRDSTWAYDKNKCVQILCDRDGASEIEGERVLGDLIESHNGKVSPAFIEFSEGYEPAAWSSD